MPVRTCFFCVNCCIIISILTFAFCRGRFAGDNGIQILYRTPKLFRLFNLKLREFEVNKQMPVAGFLNNQTSRGVK